MKKNLLTPGNKNVERTFTKILFYFLFISLITISLHADAGKGITVTVTKKSYNGSDVSCAASADAQLTITATDGTAPYMYSIDHGSTYQSNNVFNNLAGNRNYIVVVKDSKGATSSANYVWVNQAPNPVTITGINKKYYYNGNNDVSCSSASDGQVTINAWGGTGTLQYSIDGGITFQTASLFSGLAAGTYTIVVKDANGCIATSSVTLTAPSPVSGKVVSQTGTLCSALNTGTLTVSGNGGVGLYYYSLDGSSYQWSGAFTNLNAGAHTVTIKDHNGCTGSLSVNIVSSLSAVLSGSFSIVAGNSANLVVTIVGLPTTTYTVVYQDNNGHQYTANNLVSGINTINTGSLSSSLSYSLVSVTSNSGCTGTVSGSAAITVIANCQWLGLNSNWNDVTNWLDSLLPTSSNDVVIPVTANNPIISLADATVKNLTLSHGVTVTISGKKLAISGTISADTAAIIADNGIVEYNGSATQTIANHTFKNNALHDLIVSNSSATGLVLGGPLDVYGSLTFTGTGKKLITNDTLTLKSTATETAMVGNITGDSIIGKVTVERYIPGVKKAWRFLAVPTMPGQTMHDAWQEGQPANNTSLSGKGIQIQGNYSDWAARGFDGYSAAPVVKTYNPVTKAWVGVSSMLAPFSATAGGYMVFIRGDRSANAVGSPVTATVLRTKGTLNQGNQSTITVTPKQFMPVSNPYAAPLDPRNISQTGNLFFYVWDPNMSGTYGYGGYQTLVKNAAGNYIAVPGGGSYSSTGNNLIQSGSAFFAYNNNGGNLTIKENAKANTNTNIVAFTPASIQNEVEELNMHLYSVDASGNATMADGILQDFDSSYSNDIDGDDAVKSANSSENLSIVTQGQSLIIERRQTITSNDTTFLKLTGVRYTNYKFTIDAANLNVNGMQGYLIDNFTNSSTPLNMNGSTDYNFSVVNNAASYSANRFMIVYSPASILPVTITSVTATKKDAKVSVQWNVENQSNMKQYEIERSVDGSNFSKIGSVDANSNATSSYSWMDAAPATGYNYYRIASVDIDGKVTYTATVKVQMNGAVLNNISIFPNPIVDATINLQLTNQAQGTYHVKVLNQLGQQVLSTEINHAGGTSSNAIQLDQHLPHGVYNVEVVSPSADTDVIKILY